MEFEHEDRNVPLIVGALRAIPRARIRHRDVAIDSPWLVVWSGRGIELARDVVAESSLGRLSESLERATATHAGGPVVVDDERALAALQAGGRREVSLTLPRERHALDRYEAGLAVERAPADWSHYHLGVSEALHYNLYGLCLMFDGLHGWQSAASKPSERFPASEGQAGGPRAVRAPLDRSNPLGRAGDPEVRLDLLLPSEVPAGLLREVEGQRWGRTRDGRVPIVRAFGEPFGERCLMRNELIEFMGDIARLATAADRN